MVAQTTYAERHGYAVEGMRADMTADNIETRICETAGGIGFGKAVTRGTADKGVVLGGSDVNKFAGVSLLDRTLVHTTPDKYALHDSMAVLNFGMVYVVAGAAVVDGDEVFFNPTTGAFSNSAGAATVGTAALTAGSVGNGSYTPDATPAGAGIVAGTYRVVLREIVAAGGVWDVFRPDGTREGQAVTGTAYAGSIRFTIADGGTDWGAPAEWTIAVTMAGVGPVRNAKWVDTTGSAALGRINLGSVVR